MRSGVCVPRSGANGGGANADGAGGVDARVASVN